MKVDIAKINFLTHHKINNGDYEQQVAIIWKVFRLKKILKYLGLYLKRDVLLSADVYQTFRKESTNSFQTDPLHYISASGYSGDAMKKFTGVRLKLV